MAKAKRMKQPKPGKKAPQGTTVPDVGSLGARALLVDLTQHYWFGHVKDSGITDEVNKKYSAEGSYDKKLIPVSEMKEMGSRFTDVRRIHQRWTLAWSDDGWRIISSAAYFQWDKELREAIAKANTAADQFAAKYEKLIKEKAQTDKSFNPDHYPTRQALRAKYGFDVRYKPVPSGSDVRVALSDDALAAVRSSIDSDQQTRIQTAVHDIADRVKEVVGKMVERLREYKPAKGEKKAEATFKDSLITNVRELAELLPKLNITGDPRIDTMASELNKLALATPDTLRDDDKVRKSTADAADDILKRVSDFI